MAIAELVRSQSKKWEVRAEEFTWKHPSGVMGHLDILLKETGTTRHLLIEVKRPATNND